MSKEKDYEPFGDEWFLEMKKWNKTMLIDFLRTTLIEKKESKNVFELSESIITVSVENDQIKIKKTLPSRFHPSSECTLNLEVERLSDVVDELYLW